MPSPVVNDFQPAGAADAGAVEAGDCDAAVGGALAEGAADVDDADDVAEDVADGVVAGDELAAGAAAGDPHPASKTRAKHAAEPTVAKDAVRRMSPSPGDASGCTILRVSAAEYRALGP